MASDQDLAEWGPVKNGARSEHPEMVGGRYVLHAPIARGGMATIHLAHLLGAQGFQRLVTAKRLHPQFAENPDFVSMFHDEARIASRIHHPNVVPVLDVVATRGELVLVQEYVHGVPLSHLCSKAFRNEGGNAGAPIPLKVAVAIVAGVLSGLEAAHETKDGMGEPLHIVHRDVSPQNVLVSADGVARLLDFGIAKARSSGHITRAGVLKGKVAYMAPEQLRSEPATRQVDIYAAGILLWELLAHRHMRTPRDQVAMLAAVLEGETPSLRDALALTPAAWTVAHGNTIVALERVLDRALARKPEARFETAAAMGRALLEACPAATTFEVAEWVKAVASEYLVNRQQLLLSVESSVRARSGSYEVSKTAIQEMMGFPSSSRVVVVASEAPNRSFRAALPWMVVALLAGALVVFVPRAWPQKPAPAVARAPAVAPVGSAPAATPAPESVPTEAVTGVASDIAAPTPAASATPIPIPARRGKRRHGAAASGLADPAPSASPTSATSTGAEASSDPCDPPFYYEGTRKLFKPNCL
ncbi:serine/threonine protein kinase [Pendulispora rubella]|uniref:Serine/threonine protein kinase n=1 Tax=Pendulispora rubella TaxID=2741070 RepID=A0ABZ2KQP7_9BACT